MPLHAGFRPYFEHLVVREVDCLGAVSPPSLFASIRVDSRAVKWIELFPLRKIVYD
jgi:hypothetical protein